jgi:SH3-like domain-containing protein
MQQNKALERRSDAIGSENALVFQRVFPAFAKRRRWSRGRSLVLGVALWSAVGAGAAMGETYRIVGLEQGKSAHMRARPATRGKPVGYIPANARGVELAGPCKGSWCEVRYGDRTGWVSRGLLELETSEGGQRATSQSGADPAGAGTRDLSSTDASSIQGAPPGSGAPAAEPAPQASDVPKTYVIAGLSSGAALEIRETPSDDANVIGSVPFDADGLEDLGQNFKKWRHIRHQGVSGWILGRHFAHGGAEGQRFRVTGVGLMEDAPVREYPDAEAAAVGALPSHASGVVAIGSCDGQWCHVRYLGMVGWVERRFLEPLVERRG